MKKVIITSLILVASNINILANADTEKIRFITVGDTGTGALAQYEVAKAMGKKCKDSGCDFAILLGDNIYNSGVTSVDDNQFITKFEKPYENLDMPFYLTLGNHDYRGNVQAQIDYTKKSKKWKMPSNVYTLNKGIADLFCIDTNVPSNEQIEKLKKEVEKSKAKWKIVFGHHPRYTNGVYKNSTGKQAELVDEPFCNKADLYLSGHEHTKQHLKKACGMEYLVVGTGAGLRKVGVANNTLFGKSSLGFAWVEITKDKLYFEVLDTDGKVEYKYSVSKK